MPKVLTIHPHFGDVVLLNCARPSYDHPFFFTSPSFVSAPGDGGITVVLSFFGYVLQFYNYMRVLTKRASLLRALCTVMFLTLLLLLLRV